MKRQFGYIKTRYRGLAKNRAQLFSLFALGNPYLVRRRRMVRRDEFTKDRTMAVKTRQNRQNRGEISYRKSKSD
ncbi:hypothetical protein [Jannaschia helgolandensis]|uniref:hypothetical protein n=1 Tax=Jannaschia helgolandensis TaxID=188906 RepID=UPI0030DDC91F